VETYKVVLADDKPELRQILRKILATQQEMEVLGEAGDGIALLDLLKGLPILPDMVILDISMPGMGGIEATREIKLLFPGIRILIWTVHAENEFASRALLAGAEGYILKDGDIPELFEAILTLRCGGTFKSQRIGCAVA